MGRREKILHGLDLKRAAGLEIGALASPFVSKAEGDIRYVDYTDAATLRTRYASDPHVDIARIVDVDAVWGDKTILEALDGRRVDYIIGSHVIEHVPDLITWLKELHSALLPGGEVRLAIPDRRYTFDYLRAETRLCDIVSAYVVRARVPQPREIVDFCVNQVHINAVAAWQGPVDTDDLPRNFTFDGAIRLARDALQNGTYHDVHCWVFTPHSFARLCFELAKGDLLDFSCKSFLTTERNDFEFFVTLGRSNDRQQIIRSWRGMMQATAS